MKSRAVHLESYYLAPWILFITWITWLHQFPKITCPQPSAISHHKISLDPWFHHMISPDPWSHHMISPDPQTWSAQTLRPCHITGLGSQDPVTRLVQTITSYHVTALKDYSSVLYLVPSFLLVPVELLSKACWRISLDSSSVVLLS